MQCLKMFKLYACTLLHGNFQKRIYVQIARMHTFAWEFSKKDIIRGKEIQFLVIKIGSVRGPQALESLPGVGRCFRLLFCRDCNVCFKASV
jgi:hypothetical protein